MWFGEGKKFLSRFFFDFFHSMPNPLPSQPNEEQEDLFGESQEVPETGINSDEELFDGGVPCQSGKGLGGYFEVDFLLTLDDRIESQKNHKKTTPPHTKNAHNLRPQTKQKGHPKKVS